VTTDVTKLHRFDREDGSSNSLLPSTSTVARGHVVSGWRPSTISASIVS